VLVAGVAIAFTLNLLSLDNGVEDEEMMRQQEHPRRLLFFLTEILHAGSLMRYLLQQSGTRVPKRVRKEKATVKRPYGEQL
jgi:hypothetical protein